MVETVRLPIVAVLEYRFATVPLDAVNVVTVAAEAVKPQGVDSGAAMRTFDEIGDDRLMFFSQQVERAVLEIGRQMIEAAKDIYKRKRHFVVAFPQATFMESIDWADIKLDEDEYVLKAYPISTLPDDPAGRLAFVQEQMQAGLISPRAGRKLLQMRTRAGKA